MEIDRIQRSFGCKWREVRDHGIEAKLRRETDWAVPEVVIDIVGALNKIRICDSRPKEEDAWELRSAWLQVGNIQIVDEEYLSASAVRGRTTNIVSRCSISSVRVVFDMVNG